MGKTKTAFVGGVSEENLSSEEKYKRKLAKKKAEEEEAKKKVAGLGLRGGSKIKVVGATEQDVSEKEPQTTSAKEAAQPTQEETKTSEKKRKAHVRGKNYTGAKSKVDAEKLYQIPEAVKLIKSLAYAKFDETYELHLTVKKPSLSVNLTLPHNFGKGKKVEIASDKTVDELKSGKVDFDILLATAEWMPKLVPFAKLLGPKGLMPNPKNGTLIKSDKEADKFSADQKTLKTEKDQPVIHTTVGKLSMKESDVEENIQSVIDALGKQVVSKMYLKSTMSPSVKINL